MSLKLLLALAACLPLALAGCLGGGGASSSSGAGPSSGGAVRVLDRLDVIHLEMTDKVWIRDGKEVIRVRVQCSETAPTCPVTNRAFESAALEANFERSGQLVPVEDADSIVENILSTGTSTPWSGSELSAAEGELDGDLTEGGLIDFYRNTSSQANIGDVSEYLAAFGEDSGIFVFSIPTETNPAAASGRWIAESHAVAMGRDRYDDLAGGLNASWTGAMLGTDLYTSHKLVGAVEIIYRQRDDAVDVLITDIEEVTSAAFTSFGEYTGPGSLTWRGLPIDDDGSFGEEGYIEGNFYGDGGGESAGVFERRNVAGAWLAISQSERQARYTEGANQL